MKARYCVALFFTAAIIPTASLVRAQSTGTNSNLTFEVASVKPNKSNSPPSGLVGSQPGGVTFVNNTLRRLIVNAYRLKDFQVFGGPSWINSDRFDVVAKANGNPSVDQKWQMVRALLVERFKLRTHVEKRQLPLYVAVMARKDRRLGPELRRSKVDCGNSLSQCGYMRMSIYGEIVARADSINDIVTRGLSAALQGIVVDETGLTGNFDADLKWYPQALPPEFSDRSGTNAADVDRSSLFTAVQEQLGLKLVPRKGDVDVLVIDGVEHPTPD